MNIQQNFTRTWRSKTFEEIIGQDLSVRLLKNSLAKNRIFPVYLFSGLRGSGKTSIGRIFAAAVNCEKYCSKEREMYSSTIPCLSCESCLQVRAGSHPDFIEIDAASHTGVDNVRQIIEAAAFLPVMSAQKVYLIDEAHMLSKAAFNAFLKILEEPPKTVIFLLATTEVHKIPDTVRSRCFHLFFEPVPHIELIAHLKNICEVEKISFQEQALVTIAHQSEGSVRDALNCMERIVLAEDSITSEGVHRTLGLIYDALIIQLFQYIAQGSVKAVVEYCHNERFDRYNPLHIWEKMILILRILLHGKTESGYVLDVASLQSSYSTAIVLDFFDLLYRSEAHLIKTTAKYQMLESLFCKMTQRFNSSESSGLSNQQHKIPRPFVEQISIPDGTNRHAPHTTAQEIVPQIVVAQDSTDGSQGNTKWTAFIQQLEKLDHPYAASIFKSCTFKKYDNLSVQVQFAKKFEFYREWIVAHEHMWKPFLENEFGIGSVFVPEFIAEERALVKSALRPMAHMDHHVSNRPTNHREMNQDSGNNITDIQRMQSSTLQKKTVGVPSDMNDSEKWPMAHKITQMFPGTITLYKE